MERIEKDEAREERIAFDVVVDAYDAEEVAMGWYYYLADNINYPFRARCIAERSMSPLREREEVEVVGVADADDCERDMLVLIKWGDRTLGVPLSQLEPIDVDDETAQVIADWHYWVGRGYEFG